MAIADNDLFGIESLVDLQKLDISTGEEELSLSFEESALDRPILRKCTKEKGTLEEMMPKSAFLRIFRAMIKKTGYFCGTSVHAIRRYLGKKVDGMSRSPDLSSASAAFSSRPGDFYDYQLANPLMQRDIVNSSVLITQLSAAPGFSARAMLQVAPQSTVKTPSSTSPLITVTSITFKV